MRLTLTIILLATASFASPRASQMYDYNHHNLVPVVTQALQDAGLTVTRCHEIAAGSRYSISSTDAAGVKVSITVEFQSLLTTVVTVTSNRGSDYSQVVFDAIYKVLHPGSIGLD